MTGSWAFSKLAIAESFNPTDAAHLQPRGKAILEEKVDYPIQGVEGEGVIVTTGATRLQQYGPLMNEGMRCHGKGSGDPDNRDGKQLQPIVSPTVIAGDQIESRYRGTPEENQSDVRQYFIQMEDQSGQN